LDANPSGLARLAAAALLALALGACSPGRALEAADLLGDIAAGPRAPRADAAVREPARLWVAYRVEDRRREGDLYLPGEGALAALVLVPGAAPEGKDDARLVALALALARKRFEVLVPDIAAVRALKIGAADAAEIADAVRHLAARKSAAGDETAIGMVAISYALGPAILAALRPEIREEVRFVVGVGGYHDVVAAITFFTTGHYRAAGEAAWRFRPPNAYGKWIFARSNADRLEDAGDRRRLFALAERKLEDPAADVSALAAALGAEGRSVWRLLTNADPERVPALIEDLPPAIRGQIEALDLRRRDLAALAARLLLLHGRDDAIIPYTESAALAAALPERTTLYLVDSLAHVDLGPAGLADTLALWHAAYRLLEERDAAARLRRR
jgi:hypothetical protein